MKLIDIITPAPSISVHTTGEELLRLFQELPDLALVAVLDAGNSPVGAVDRLGFLNAMSGRFGPALYLRRSIALIMNETPVLADAEHELASFLAQNTSACAKDPLLDGLIVVQNARYVGVVSGPQILRAISLQALHDVQALQEAITEKLHYERRITHLALHDALTSLPNRRYFDDAIATALSDAKNGRAFTLLSLDLDRFKPVNDQYGHGMGDLLLRNVAERLRDAIEGQDATAFRLGGDEFAVILRDPSPNNGQTLATALLDTLGKPFFISSETLEIGVSIGLSRADGQSLSSHDLIREADRALYAAKTLGGRLWRSFTPEMTGHDRHDPTLAADLGQALPNGELAVHFQPIYSTAADAVIGFEALLRWSHPTHGAVPPDRFIPIAEATGLIDQVGLFVLEQSCLKLAELPPRLHVSVNLSPRQFAREDLAAQIAGVIARTSIHPGRIWFEITENVLLHDTQRNLETLNAIRALGIRVAIDDFGTGYSSLHYVEAFTPDKIKIDRSFVARMGGSRNARAIINSVVQLAHNMGIEVTAEGVETQSQYDTLCDFGCDEIQGFLIGRPSAQPALHFRARQNALAHA